MARKTSRRVAVSKRKKSPAAKGRKLSSASVSAHKTASAENFVRCIRTLHDLGLVTAFVQSAKGEKLTLTMDTAAFERVKKSVNKLRQPTRALASLRQAARGVRPSPDNDPFDFGSSTPGGLRRGVKPLPGDDPFDF